MSKSRKIKAGDTVRTLLDWTKNGGVVIPEGSVGKVVDLNATCVAVLFDGQSIAFVFWRTELVRAGIAS